MYLLSRSCAILIAIAAQIFAVQNVSAQTIDELRESFKGYRWGEIEYSDRPANISKKEWRGVYRAFEGSWDGRSRSDHNHRIGYIYNRDTEKLKVLFFLYNAHAIDGDTVCLFTSFNDAQRIPMVSQFMRLGINAQLGGHANRRVEYQEYEISQEVIQSFESVSFAVKECDKYSDGKIVSVVADKIKPLFIGACSAYTGQVSGCTIGTEAIMRQATR